MKTKAAWLNGSHGNDKRTPDVLVANEGTVFVFCPLTAAAKEWIDENVESEAWQWFGNSLVVDHRFA